MHTHTSGNIKPFDKLTSQEQEQWIIKAEYLQERGIYPTLDVYKLAEIIYSRQA